MTGWWKAWRRRARCMHHNHHTGDTSIVLFGILDRGRKRFACGKVFFR